MKKLLFAAAFVCGLTTLTFAGNPKGETKDAKTEVKTQEVLTTYYVTGSSGMNYLISTNPSNNANCTGGTHPCKFTSPDASLGTSVPKTKVVNEEDDIEVETFRPTEP